MSDTEYDKWSWKDRYEVPNSPGRRRDVRLRRSLPVIARQIKETMSVFDALKAGDRAVLNDLCGRGYDMEVTDRYGFTPLIYTASLGRHELVRDLCFWEVNVNARDKKERTALHHASNHNFPEVVQVLTQYKADINCQDYEKMTPLHSAVYHGHTQVVKRLLSAGAKLTLKNMNGRTPEKLAEETPNSSEILNLLREEKRKRDVQPWLKKIFSRSKKEQTGNWDRKEQTGNWDRKEQTGNWDWTKYDSPGWGLQHKDEEDIYEEIGEQMSLALSSSSSSDATNLSETPLALSNTNKPLPLTPMEKIITSSSHSMLEETIPKAPIQGTLILTEPATQATRPSTSHTPNMRPPQLPPRQKIAVSCTPTLLEEYGSLAPALDHAPSAAASTNTDQSVRDAQKPPWPSDTSSKSQLEEPPQMLRETQSAVITWETKASVPTYGSKPPLPPRPPKMTSTSSFLSEEQTLISSPKIEPTNQTFGSDEEQMTDLAVPRDNLYLALAQYASISSVSGKKVASSGGHVQPTCPAAPSHTQDPETCSPCENKSETSQNCQVAPSYLGNPPQPLLSSSPRQRRLSPFLPRSVSSPELFETSSAKFEKLRGESWNKVPKKKSASLLKSKNVNKKIHQTLDKALSEVLIEPESSSCDENMSSSTDRQNNDTDYINLSCNINIAVNVKSAKLVACQSTMSLYSNDNIGNSGFNDDGSYTTDDEDGYEDIKISRSMDDIYN